MLAAIGTGIIAVYGAIAVVGIAQGIYNMVA